MPTRADEIAALPGVTFVNGHNDPRRIMPGAWRSAFLSINHDRRAAASRPTLPAGRQALSAMIHRDRGPGAAGLPRARSGRASDQGLTAPEVTKGPRRSSF